MVVSLSYLGDHSQHLLFGYYLLHELEHLTFCFSIYQLVYYGSLYSVSLGNPANDLKLPIGPLSLLGIRNDIMLKLILSLQGVSDQIILSLVEFSLRSLE